MSEAAWLRLGVRWNENPSCCIHRPLHVPGCSTPGCWHLLLLSSRRKWKWSYYHHPPPPAVLSSGVSLSDKVNNSLIDAADSHVNAGTARVAGNQFIFKMLNVKKKKQQQTNQNENNINTFKPNVKYLCSESRSQYRITVFRFDDSLFTGDRWTVIPALLL